ncbi:hypothetical protein BLL52_0014 [Rhodoferax antarcticus ANT.BR]|uniref:Uncharacterized protein n=1 Tax=Rhodoferax antarcticus ANT.BR TaxID=1111071 RepID=A0A1Q8YK23_9BURK|nr:hypothetical protein BLL52_0014 [Rhodoferax antarcticus ANT.BR]
MKTIGARYDLAYRRFAKIADMFIDPLIHFSPFHSLRSSTCP